MLTTLDCFAKLLGHGFIVGGDPTVVTPRSPPLSTVIVAMVCECAQSTDDQVCEVTDVEVGMRPWSCNAQVIATPDSWNHMCHPHAHTHNGVHIQVIQFM